MKKRLFSLALIFAFSLSYIPAAVQDVSANTAEEASFTINGAISFNGGFVTGGVALDGLRLRDRGDGSSQVSSVTHEGRHGIRGGDGGNDWVQVFVDKPALRNADTVTMEITFFDDAPGSIHMNYTRVGSTHHGLNISKSGSRQWVTVWIVLEECAFTTSQGHGNQIRFGSGAIIHSLKLTLGAVNPAAAPPPRFAPSTAFNDFSGKGIVMYQMWFNAGEGSDWSHWGKDSNPPGPGGNHLDKVGYVNVEQWPCVRDYRANGAVLHNTNLAPLGDGTPAQVYNARDEIIVDTHFQWLAEHGIDGVNFQRWGSASS
jgi:hypothetical protein